MSIQEFHSQLAQLPQADAPDSMIAILGRLTAIDESLVTDAVVEFMGPWAAGVSSS
jgi:hypothetical protein